MSGLHVVETLQEREHSRFATAGVTDQPNAFAGQDAEREILKYSLTVRVGEIDMLEFEAGAAADERLRLRIVAQFMRHQ